jgi:hypothetical protein
MSESTRQAIEEREAARAGAKAEAEPATSGRPTRTINGQGGRRAPQAAAKAAKAAESTSTTSSTSEAGSEA